MEATQEISNSETSKQLQDRLDAAGDSLYAFANRNNFKYNTVCKVARVWWHRHDRQPHGGVSREIIAQMRVEFSHD